MARRSTVTPIGKAERTPPNAVVSAAHRLDVTDRAEAAKQRRRKKAWQEEAWGYLDDIGEIKYAYNYLGSAISRVRLFVGFRTDPDAAPAPAMEEGGEQIPGAMEAQDLLYRLDSSPGGIPGILKDLTINLEVPGECYLLGLPPGDSPEEWDIKSIDELVVGDSGYGLKPEPGMQSGLPLPDNAYVVRIWNRHPRFSDTADSLMRAVLSLCDELLILSRAIRMTGKSRLAQAGILFVANEFSFGPLDPTASEQDGEGTSDPFADTLMEAMITAIQDEASAAGAVPLVMRGPAELGKNGLFHLRLDRPLDPEMTKQRAEVLTRIATGLNLPSEVLTGISNVNHWGAWLVDESTFKYHVEPRVLGICQALTQAFLYPILVAPVTEGGYGVDELDAEKLLIWYDPTELVTHPDRVKDAQSAYDAMELRGATYLKALGFNPEEDAPDDEELKKRLALSATRMDPTILGQLIQETFGPDIEVPAPASGELPAGGGSTPAPVPDPSQPEQGPPPANQPTDTSSPVAASAFVASGRVARLATTDTARLGRRLFEIDQKLRYKLGAATNSAVRRALQAAGAKIKSKAARDRSVQSVASAVKLQNVAFTVGPALVHQLGLSEDALLANTFADLADDFEAWVAAAQAETVKVLDKMGVIKSKHQRDAMEARQAQDRHAANEWFIAQVAKATTARLYDPNPQAPPTGEHDPDLLIQAGVIRNALARAGGAVHGITAAATLEAMPSGGVALGPVSADAIDADPGVEVAGYEWVYGISTRSFEPHLALDGVAFEGFDDDVLSNDEGWPETDYYYPGDHDGCQCDFMPTLISAADAGGDMSAQDITDALSDIPRSEGEGAGYGFQGEERVGADEWLANHPGMRDYYDLAQRWSNFDVDASKIGEAATGANNKETEWGAKLAHYMDHAPRIDGTLYRGAQYDADVKIGDSISLRPSSFSRARGVAESYAETASDMHDVPRPTVFEVNNARGLPIDNLSSFSSGEQEVISGGNFRVTNVSERETYGLLTRVVTLEQI